MSAEIKATILSIDEIRTGEGLWRVGILFESDTLSEKRQIWSTEEYIEDFLRLKSGPGEEDVKKLALLKAKEWIDETGKIPVDLAWIITNRGALKTNDPLTYIKKLDSSANQIRTNINLPPTLYDWAKSKAQADNTSLSEIVRQGLVEIKRSSENVEEWLISNRQRVATALTEHGFRPGFFEVAHYLAKPIQDYNQAALLEAARNSAIRKTGWPIGIVTTGGSGSPKPTEDGVIAEYVGRRFFTGYDFWYLKNYGEFYFARDFEEDNTPDKNIPGSTMWFDIRIRRIIEAFDHCVALYRCLGVDSSSDVSIKINLLGISGRQLSAWDPQRLFTARSASVSKIGWEVEVSLKSLEEKLDDFVYDAASKLAVVFDFFEPEKKAIESIISDYKSSRG